MNLDELTQKAKNIRKNILTMLSVAGSGHTGGSMGIADILTYLYFSEMRVNPQDPQMPERDRFVLSAAHMAPALYATLAEAGFFHQDELLSLRRMGSRMQGHTVRNMTIGVETTGGSLGQGVSIACGMAAAAKIDHKDWRVFCVLGDGESNEGSVWEAALFAAKFELDNLIFIIDRNNIQLSGNAEDIMPMTPMADKWKAFNWQTIECNGHDYQDIATAFLKAKEEKHRPTCIIANTVPGKGVSFIENKWEWHGKVPNEEQLKTALLELGN